MSAFLFASPALSVSLSDVHVGAVYYHNSWNNNRKVQVLGVRGSVVKVQFLEGSNAGAIEFVSASDLLTPNQSRKEAMEDAAEGVVVAGAIFCAMFGCENNKKPNSNRKAAPYSSSKAIAPRPIVVANNCRNPVKVAVRYRDKHKNWTTASWYSIKPRGRTRLADRANKVLGATNPVVYYYAYEFNAKGHPRKWAGKTPIKVGGKTYNFRKIHDGVGEALIKLCS